MSSAETHGRASSEFERRIWVVGSVNIDHTMYLDRLPAQGETAIGSQLEIHIGGKGANQAVACALLGADVNLVACVGPDAESHDLKGNLTERGVSVQYMQRSDNLTGTALVLVDENGDNSIAVFPGANGDLQVNNLPLGSSDAVLLQCEVDMEVLEYTVQLARESGCLIVLNAAPAADLPPKLLEDIDVLVVNEGEASACLGISEELLRNASFGDPASAKAVVTAAQGACAEVVVVTLGSLGSLVVENGLMASHRAHAVTARDSVGAGDSFVAALLVAIFEGAPVEDAVSRATAAAALTVQRLGTFEAFPSADEVDHMTKKTQR